MILIELTQGHKTLIDEEDADRINQWKWKIHPQGYASRTSYVNQRSGTILLHRFILNAPKEMEVDHINGNKLDNRRTNLRLITPLEHRLHHIGPLIESAKRRQIYPDYKDCVRCGQNFKVNPRKRKRNKTCSPACATAIRVDAALRSRGLSRKYVSIECENCGTELIPRKRSTKMCRSCYYNRNKSSPPLSNSSEEE